MHRDEVRAFRGSAEQPLEQVDASDVTVGLQPFNTPHDIDQLVRAVASLG